eukprot:5311488-Pyramimonas_sp.AAC.2
MVDAAPSHTLRLSTPYLTTSSARPSAPILSVRGPLELSQGRATKTRPNWHLVTLLDGDDLELDDN